MFLKQILWPCLVPSTAPDFVYGRGFHNPLKEKKILPDLILNSFSTRRKGSKFEDRFGEHHTYIIEKRSFPQTSPLEDIFFSYREWTLFLRLIAGIWWGSVAFLVIFRFYSRTFGIEPKSLACFPFFMVKLCKYALECENKQSNTFFAKLFMFTVYCRYQILIKMR